MRNRLDGYASTIESFGIDTEVQSSKFSQRYSFGECIGILLQIAPMQSIVQCAIDFFSYSLFSPQIEMRSIYSTYCGGLSAAIKNQCECLKNIRDFHGRITCLLITEISLKSRKNYKRRLLIWSVHSGSR